MIRRLPAESHGSCKMLANFFKLNEPWEEWPDAASFRDALRDATEIGHMQYTPADLKKVQGFRSIEKKTFRNVSFSKTKIANLVFRDCRFEDCLFIAVDFFECELHHCVFKNCNMYKVSFERTYVDPDAFLFAMDPDLYANIGVGLFQTLSRDLANQNQHSLRAKAEFLFEKWLRYQLKYDFEQQRISRAQFRIRRVWRLFFELSTGYGWKPWRLVLTIVITCLVLLVVNYSLWNSYAIRSSIPDLNAGRSVLNCVYYTCTLLTTLGPMGLTPTSATGIAIASAHSVLGVLLFALLASLMFRLVVKTT
jgi:hypothetical protein